MNMETSLFLALAVLLGNAFFVGAEFALVSARRSNIELKALEGSRAAKLTLSGMEQVSLMLAGAQPPAIPGLARGCSSMAEHQLPKLTVRVRFPSPAPRQKPRSGS